MKAESTTKPNKVAVDRIGDKAIIHLFDNILNTVNDEGIEIYESDHLTLEIPFRPGLETIVLSDFEGWVIEAKKGNDIYTPSNEDKMLLLEAAVLELAEMISEVSIND